MRRRRTNVNKQQRVRQRGLLGLGLVLAPAITLAVIGDRVTRGQLLGRLGNTGSTSNPHLHFQLSDGPDIITSNSLPFVLDRYTLAGTVAPEAWAAAMASDTAPTGFPVTPMSEVQTGTYPLLLSVIDVP
jgi:hypothetical protein